MEKGLAVRSQSYALAILIKIRFVAIVLANCHDNQGRRHLSPQNCCVSDKLLLDRTSSGVVNLQLLASAQVTGNHEQDDTCCHFQNEDGAKHTFSMS